VRSGRRAGGGAPYSALQTVPPSAALLARTAEEDARMLAALQAGWDVEAEEGDYSGLYHQVETLEVALAESTAQLEREKRRSLRQREEIEGLEQRLASVERTKKLVGFDLQPSMVIVMFMAMPMVLVLVLVLVDVHVNRCVVHEALLDDRRAFEQSTTKGAPTPTSTQSRRRCVTRK